MVDEAPEVVAPRVGNVLANEVPEHCPELELLVECDTVVDRPDLVIDTQHTVAGLTVGVVDHDVEGADPTELIVVAIRFLMECVVMLLEHARHEELQGADTVDEFAFDGGRDEIPTERLACDERGDLALVEAVGEIPQG